MRIVILSGTAPPEPLAASRINWDLANYLALEGHTVWLISPKPSRPLGTKYPELKGIHIRRISDNFSHVYVNSFTCPGYNLFLRSYESLDFGIKSISYVNRKIRNYDLIYSSTWPFLCQLMTVILRKNKKIPLIMNIQDLYPESFFTKIKSKVLCSLFRPLYSIDKLVAQRSTHVTVVSESLRQVYLTRRKISDTKVSVIHNWQDSDEFVNLSASAEEIADRYGLNSIRGKFVFMYLGNLGPVAGVETLLHSFSVLDEPCSYLIIAGAGSAKEKCRLLARKLNITNVSFVEVPPDLRSVAELQSIADVLLLPINPGASNSSIPSKLIAYMFSKKPVITSADKDSETARAVSESGCGWITATNDSPEWKNVMKLTMNQSNSTLRRMGHAGFNYAIRQYSRSEGLKKVESLILRITKN